MPYVDIEQRRANWRRWYQSNKDKWNDKNKEWRANNYEKAKAIGRNSHHKNKHKYTEIIKSYKARNRDKINEYRRMFKQKNKEEWLAILGDLGMDSCSACGYSKCFAALDFHHRLPSEKTELITRILYEKVTDKRLEEIKKCVVLCSNCHREAHNGNL